MICKQCGNTININDSVCPVCGAEVEIQTMLVDDDIPSEQNSYPAGQAAEPQYAQPVQPQYAQPQPVQPQYAQPQPVQPQYAPPQPVQQPVQPKPMRPQYVCSQPVQPQYAQPQPVQPQPVQPVQPQYAQPQYAAQPQYGQVQPGVTPESQALSKSILGFGIAAVICAWFPIASILGIIFGSIAKGRAKTFDLNGYPTNGRRVAGKVLGIIGLVGGIIMTVYYFFYLIVILSVI